jgi:hypothetical protein
VLTRDPKPMSPPITPQLTIASLPPSLAPPEQRYHAFVDAHFQRLCRDPVF